MKTTSLFQWRNCNSSLRDSNWHGSPDFFLFGSQTSPQRRTFGVEFFAGAFFVLGFGALFARQSQRGGIWDWSAMSSLCWLKCILYGSDAVTLGIAAGVISQEQIVQVPSMPCRILSCLGWVEGLIAFGISITGTSVSEVCGVLLILLGLIQYSPDHWLFSGLLCSLLFAVWAWLVWSLYSKSRIQGDNNR